MKPNSIGVDSHGLSEERSNKKAVLTFGRFNPPTSGHELLISKVVGEHKEAESRQLRVRQSFSRQAKESARLKN